MTVRFIVPELKTPAAAAAAIELVQQVALALHVPEADLECAPRPPFLGLTTVRAIRAAVRP